MPLVHLKTGRLEYKFEINNKYNIIKGDSGTGKTTLYDLVRAYKENEKSVQNISGVKIDYIPIDSRHFNLDSIEDSVIIIDEGCKFLKQHDIASILQKSNNYFVIINRKISFGYLPIHVDNVFKVKSSGKFHTLERIYQRFDINNIKNVDTIIIEDRKSGYFFIKDLLSTLDTSNIILEPAYGSESDRAKSNNGAGNTKVAKSMEYYANLGRKDIFVVYDASDFGGYIDLVVNVINRFKSVNFYICDWDSFEYYILGSAMYEKHLQLKDINYNYESFEQYCTSVLSKFITGYDKGNLSLCLSRNRCKKCAKGTGCKYRLKSYDNLVYEDMRLLYASVKKKDMYEELVNAFYLYYLKRDR